MKNPILFLLLAPALAAQTTVEEILVVVNNHIITRKAFQQAVEQQHAELYRRYSGKELDSKLADAREKTLQEMIDIFVLIDVATDNEMIAQAPSEADFIDDIKRRANISSDAELERAVRSEAGISLGEFIRIQRNSYIVGMLLQYEVYSKVPIEEQEAKLYYNEHQADYKSSARFRIRELILPKGATQADRASASELLDKVQSELATGRPFESLVEEHSGSPSRGTGGDLGWLDKGYLLPAIESAALALNPNEVSGAIETDKDYILIQLVAKEMEGVKPFSSVKDEIVQKLQAPKAENAKELYLQSQRVRANIRYMVPRALIIKG